MYAVVDPDKAKKYAGQYGCSEQALMKNKDFINQVYADLMHLATQNKFNSLERPKQMTLLLDPFTIENGLLTPTMKLKRNIAKD